MTKDPERLEKRPDGLAMLAVLVFCLRSGGRPDWRVVPDGPGLGGRPASSRDCPCTTIASGRLSLGNRRFAAAVALAAWMVRRFAPYASGSGIPHVEAVILKQLPQAPVWLIPVKFIGGVLAIGSGLALGREGPSVQRGRRGSLTRDSLSSRFIRSPGSACCRGGSRSRDGFQSRRSPEPSSSWKSWYAGSIRGSRSPPSVRRPRDRR